MTRGRALGFQVRADGCSSLLTIAAGRPLSVAFLHQND
jgi:hypothetical protein